MEQISFGTMRSGCFTGALQVGNEETFSKRQAILSRLDRRLSNLRYINLFSLHLYLDVIVYACEVIVLLVSVQFKSESELRISHYRAPPNVYFSKDVLCDHYL